MDPDSYLTTNFLETFAETLGLVVVGVGVIVPGTVMGLYDVVLMVINWI